MRELGIPEIIEVSGGIANIAFGAVAGLGGYALNQYRNHEPMTFKGAAIATGFGAITGGLGGAAVRAAGGGLVGNAVWRPGFMAINSSGQLIASDKSRR